jgi:hypothetical protein
MCVQAVTTAHNIPLALRVFKELFIGYNDVPGPSEASRPGVGRGIGGLWGVSSGVCRDLAKPLEIVLFLYGTLRLSARLTHQVHLALPDLHRMQKSQDAFHRLAS